MTSQENSLNWFEISVSNMDRAKAFYENAFNIQMPTETMMGMDMAYFPSEPGNGKASGALVKSEYHKPSMEGARIYLNANPDLSNALSKIEAAGCTITLPKTKISDDVGYMAFFVDTEGNLVGLHSNK
jgi:hypothetical protein